MLVKKMQVCFNFLLLLSLYFSFLPRLLCHHTHARTYTRAHTHAVAHSLTLRAHTTSFRNSQEEINQLKQTNKTLEEGYKALSDSNTTLEEQLTQMEATKAQLELEYDEAKR